MGRIGRTYLIFSSLLLLSLAACAGLKEAEIPAGQVKERSHSPTQSVYPEEFTLSQHILLTLREKEYDFMAYLAVDRSRGYRALAFTDMGGKVFDFLSLGNESKIVSKPGIMPEAPILKGVMEEIGLIFISEAGDDGLIQPGLKGLSSVKAEYVAASSADGRILSYELKKGDSLISKISLSKYRIFPGWERPLPSEIDIKNYRWNYTVHVTLLKINTAPINEKVLAPQISSND